MPGNRTCQCRSKYQEILLGVVTCRTQWLSEDCYAMQVPKLMALSNLQVSLVGRRDVDVGCRSRHSQGDEVSLLCAIAAATSTPGAVPVKVPLAWDSHVKFNSILALDLDLWVRDSNRTLITWSVLFDKYPQIVFVAAADYAYRIDIRRWSVTENVWYGEGWMIFEHGASIPFLAELSNE